jgi:hypothetical protein
LTTLAAIDPTNQCAVAQCLVDTYDSLTEGVRAWMIGEELFFFVGMRYPEAARQRQRIGGWPFIVARRTQEHPFGVALAVDPYRD